MTREENKANYWQGFKKCLEEVKLFFENNDMPGADTVVNRLESLFPVTTQPDVLTATSMVCSVIKHTSQSAICSTEDDLTGQSEECVWRPW